MRYAQLAAAGKLGPAQLTYAGATKPREALYDTEKDPWQVNNVADDPTHRPVLERMRKRSAIGRSKRAISASCTRLRPHGCRHAAG